MNESKRLHVAIDATPLLARPTGIGVFTSGLLCALASSEQIDASAFAISWRRRDRLATALPSGVAVNQRAMPARPLLFSWRHLNHPALERFVASFDVVHGTNYTVPPTKRASKVLSVHDLTTLHYPELCDAATRHYPELIKRAIGSGAFIHADSSFIAREIEEAFAIPAERVRTVHLGLPTLPTGDPSTARNYLPSGIGRYVLSVGTAEPRKDLVTLVRAFDGIAASERDLALVLAGPGGWGEAALLEAIEQCTNRSRIVRTGWVEDAVLGSLFANAAVLAYPSIYEGFGYPPLQAMKAGVPVVATRAGSLPEVLGDAARLVEVGDTDALAEALRIVLDDDSARRTMIDSGVAQSNRFSWERCAHGMVRLYWDAWLSR